MSIYYQDEHVTRYHCDCLAVLRTLPGDTGSTL